MRHQLAKRYAANQQDSDIAGHGAAGGSVRVGGSPASRAGWLEHACWLLPIMQRPRAHIIRQGTADAISGAIPTAVSQFQPSARPVPAAASPATASTRRSPTQYRKMPARSCVREPAGGLAISMLCIISLRLHGTSTSPPLTRALRGSERCRAANTKSSSIRPSVWRSPSRRRSRLRRSAATGQANRKPSAASSGCQ
jgi:hypothetical protein